jgi:aquaporin Z
MTLTIGRSSGAHINPAITIANTLAGNLRRELVVPYVLFQLAGAMLAGASLRLAFGASVPSAHLGSTKLALGISPLDGVALEAIGTFVLAMSALGASAFVRSWYKRAALVGFTLFWLIIFIGPLTGASFNPARSLGPSVFSGYFDSQSVYWVGPLGGAACAGLTFRLWVRGRGQRESERGPNTIRVC